MKYFGILGAIWALALLSSFSFRGTVKHSWRIMTYNIHHGTDAKENDQLQEMGAFIRQVAADIVTLQEVDSVTNRSHHINQMKILAGITGFHYAFVRHFPYDGGAYGLGILSRFPIKDVRQFKLPLLHPNALRNSTALLVVTIALPGGKNINVASAHFALDQPSRLQQAADCRRILSALDNPFLFTGDLNALPQSPEIESIKQWAFMSDRRFHSTFPAGLPTKKIDYIFAKKAASIHFSNHQVFNVEFSDHCPVMTRFHVK